MGIFGLGSSIEGLKLLTKTESLWDLGSALSKMSMGDAMKLGGAQKYAAATGDLGPIQSMYADGGVFGKPKPAPTRTFGGYYPDLIGGFGKKQSNSVLLGGS